MSRYNPKFIGEEHSYDYWCKNKYPDIFDHILNDIRRLNTVSLKYQLPDKRVVDICANFNKTQVRIAFYKYKPFPNGELIHRFKFIPNTELSRESVKVLDKELRNDLICINADIEYDSIHIPASISIDSGLFGIALGGKYNITPASTEQIINWYKTDMNIMESLRKVMSTPQLCIEDAIAAELSKEL